MDFYERSQLPILSFEEETADLDYGMIRKRIRELRKSFIARDQMNINGDDLMILGYRGREIGQILDDLYEQILRDEIKNDHEELMKATLKGSN